MIVEAQLQPTRVRHFPVERSQRSQCPQSASAVQPLDGAELPQLVIAVLHATWSPDLYPAKHLRSWAVSEDGSRWQRTYRSRTAVP